MTVQNVPVKEMLDKSVPVREVGNEFKETQKLKKSTKKFLREAMEIAFLHGACSFDNYTGQFIYTADRNDIQKHKLDGVVPGMKFFIPLKQVRFGKKVRRVV